MAVIGHQINRSYFGVWIQRPEVVSYKQMRSLYIIHGKNSKRMKQKVIV